MTGIILAGGKSTRLGEDKAFIKLDSATLLEAVLATVQKVVAEIIIVANKLKKFADFLSPEIQIIQDKIPYQGPLGGILAGLEASNDLYNLIVPCDAPFLKEELLKELLSQADGYDAVVPKINKKLEPLIAVYSKRCVEPIRASLEKKNFRIVSFFDRVNIKYVTTDIINKCDRDKLSFFNINTKKDLEKARRVFAR